MRSGAFQSQLVTITTLLNGLSTSSPHITEDIPHFLRDADPASRDWHRSDIIETRAEIDKDLSLLSNIEGSIAGIRKALNKRRFECDMSISPIYALPPEILARIFEWIISPDVAAEWSFPNIGRRWLLLKVSRQWREVILNHPTLWTYQDLDFFHSLSQARRRFTRAGNLPLWVYFQTDRSHLHPDHLRISSRRDKPEDFLWIPRIQTLTLSAHDVLCQCLLSHLLVLCPEGSLPHLRTLTVMARSSHNCSECSSTAPPIMTLSASHYPSMQNLYINGDVLDYDDSDLHNLCSIGLSNVQNLRWSNFKTMLGSAARLKNLTIRNVDFAGPNPLDNNGANKNMSKINLPCLQSICLGPYDLPNLIYVIQHILAPVLKTLVIDGNSCDLGDQTAEFFMDDKQDSIFAVMKELVRLETGDINEPILFHLTSVLFLVGQDSSSYRVCDKLLDSNHSSTS